MPYISTVPGSSLRRHPDRDYRIDSLLQGQSVTAPVIYLFTAALTLVAAFAVAFMCLRCGPTAVSRGAAMAAHAVLFAFTLLMGVTTVVCCWKGLRWRAARRAYSQNTGQADLGYFGKWDGLGERTDAEILAQAESLVRAAKTKPQQ